MQMFKAAKAPAPKDPAPMPDVDDEAVARAKQRSLLSMSQRSGRMSTLLSSGNDKLGG